MALQWPNRRNEGTDGRDVGTGQIPPTSPGDKLRVIIIGGSTAGLSCAHALLNSGACKVMVLEKAKTLAPEGFNCAGLAIDRVSCEALEEWRLRDKLFLASRPLDQEEIRGVDSDRKDSFNLCRDEGFRHRAVHWSDLHRILYEALPSDVRYFGHEAVSLRENEDHSTINVTVLETGSDDDDTKTVTGDIIVAADGAMSTVRKFYWPDEQRRYAGYCAWRGILDCSGAEELYKEIKEHYPEMGETLYFELGRRSHSVAYELQGKKVNWLWYVNQPEPVLEGNSMTLHPDEATIAALYRDADRNLMPTLAKMIKLTPKPFLNVIYDKDPPKQIAWRRVVLVGEAAHPTTPHALRSSNMSIADAFALGKAFQKYGPKNVNAALAEYESKRLPVSTQQVLFSRHLGQLKQGRLNEPMGSFPWRPNDETAAGKLLIKNMSSFQI